MLSARGLELSGHSARAERLREKTPSQLKEFGRNDPLSFCVAQSDEHAFSPRLGFGKVGKCNFKQKRGGKSLIFHAPSFNLDFFLKNGRITLPL
ncbi:hypothetical protein BWI96_07190 [Siphonobacter sp. SORGH_AS_0500]|nr:hypothetical protein BWI96_07190 [Siphonobacter sp. SORGH_AS_0500]